ncbi:MAG: cryptochrome/photolyase family protein, partial [Cyanobacteriota bacterium]
MTLTLILGDQLHRDWFSPSYLNIGAGERVVMIEDLGVASSYRYHKLRLLHTFVAMRHFRDSLLQRGVELRYFELPESAAMPFWQRLADELGDGRELRVAEIA